ncbi:MAG: ChaN family lipoprotein [Octadecabacter sp.]
MRLVAIFLIWAGSVTAEGADLVGFVTPDVDIYVLGEVHDNPAHHERQAAMIARIAPSAIVFEMITAQQATGITLSLRQDADALADALGWGASGWPPFSMYYPLFAAVGDAPIFGALVTREVARDAMRLGPDAVFGDDAQRFGLTAPLAPDQQGARNALQDDAHCNGLPAEMLPAMVNVQRLRDAQLARAALAALDGFGAAVVVITGNGHARRDWGVPAMIARVRPEAVVISVGQGEDGIAPEGGFDVVFDAPAPERDDPCAAFR